MKHRIFLSSLCPLIVLVLFAMVLGTQAARAELLHRWSFNEAAGGAPAGTVLLDSVVSLPMTVRGQGASFDGSRITLPGTTRADQPESSISAYLDIPNGIVSSKTSITIEVWAAPLGGRDWAPLFDFGRWNSSGDGQGAPGEWTGASAAVPPGNVQSGDALALLLSRGTDLNQQRMGITRDEVRVELDTDLPTTAGQTYHYVLTVTDGAGAHGAAGMQVGWYRDGVWAGSRDLPYRLEEIEDVNCWFGRLQWTSLGVAHAAYDEVRIYNHAFTLAEVGASRAAGPDAVFGPPVLEPDNAMLHHGHKVRVAVLANDPAGVSPSSVQVVEGPEFGTAVPDSAGRILYQHTVGTPEADSFTYRAGGGGGLSEPVAVTLNFATSLRIANTNFNVPNLPPVTTVQLEPAFGDLTFAEPIALATPPGETRRLFVIERRVGVRLIPNVTASVPSSTLFFNLAGYLASRGELLGDTFDQGFMGLTFHPGYATNRYFYVCYSARVAGLDYLRLSRFTTQTANSNAVDSTSELVLLQQRDENGYHLAMDIHFGPDGYLYLAIGDGGGQNDSRGNGQVIDRDFFCAILRIDVDRRPGNREPNVHPAVPRDGGFARYLVPVDNPFVTDDPTVPYHGANLPAASVRTEFWAHGFRNPWRFSFDHETGELWTGDVGQVALEEVNLVTRGGNYGWAYREGTLHGPRVWEQPPGYTSLPPLYEYGQGNGSFQGFSISGGVVYRGTNVSSLTGAYMFADYVSGHIWALRREGATVDVQRVVGEAGVTSFGLDPATGDLLAVDHGGSRILRFVTGTNDVSGYPPTLSATGLFADLTDLAPAPGLLPYIPNLRFWSDYADKRRWFVIPEASSRIHWEQEEPWAFPEGMIWVKHFDLELERGNPTSARRIETRLLVKNAGGSYGVSYRWNESQTDATLVPDGGDNFAVEVVEGGQPRVQNYRIPSRAECLACHTPQAGHALSFDTRQLNRDAAVHGFAGNQITLLRDAGYFHNSPVSPNLLPRHVRPDEMGQPIEARVRSYLAVNCANCHRAGGTGPTSWDGRPWLTLEETGLLNGLAVNNGTDPANRLVVPGDAVHSILLNRVAVANGFTRMPQLGSTELDHDAIALLTDWIVDTLPNRQTYGDWRLARFESGTSPDGAPEANPDADAASNYAEFLAGTDPLNSAEYPSSTISVTGPSVTLEMDLPANRWFQVESSPNLVDWLVWDVPGNHGLQWPGGRAALTGTVEQPHHFFRFVIGEN